MKIIKITESQYKRLVSKKLNESIIYNNSEDKSDVTILIRDFLKLLSDTLLINHKQNVYVDKIVDGVVYIDGTKYNEEEKNLIEYFIDWWVDNGNVNTPHKKIDGVTYDSGKDWDYNENIVNDTKCWCNDEQNGEEIGLDLSPGSIIVYRGCDIEHWREPFKGKNHAQVFLHYNDVNNPNAIPYDGRPHLGLPAWFKTNGK